MLVYLWDASHCHGVTDDLGRAREAAAACISNGQATGALVEAALLVSGFAHLTYGYQRTGKVWRSRVHNGRIAWQRLAS
jgi:hypothetical protein